MNESQKITTDLLNSLGESFLFGPAYLGRALEQTGNLSFFNSASAFASVVKSASVTAARALTIPDPGADASFVMTQGTQTISGTKTFDGQLIGKGTATNNNAATGYIGETVSSSISTATNFPATTVFGDLTSISLTAGDWLVSAVLAATANGSTTTNVQLGISQTTGNSATGLVLGDNYVFLDRTALLSDTLTIPSFRQSLSTTTTIYLKYVATYGVATPQAYGRLSAVRIR